MGFIDVADLVIDFLSPKEANKLRDHACYNKDAKKLADQLVGALKVGINLAEHKRKV